MMMLIGEIIRPYAEFIIAASYNLQQTLEGLGAKVDAGHEAVIPGAAMYTILEPGIPIWLVVFCVILAMWAVMFLSSMASYCVGLRGGALASVGVWLLPGALSLLNLWPHYRGVPDAIHLGTSAAIGSPWGMLPIVSLGLVAGWSLAIIMIDLIGLGNKYQSYFDHLWVAAAVITGLFFVADSSTRQNEQALTETSENVRLASSYLLQQVKRYDHAFCQSANRSQDASCRWVADIQGKLVDFAYSEYRIFWTVGPGSSAELYAPYVRHPSEDSLAKLRAELDTVNRSLCGGEGARSDEWCEITPAAICNPDEQHFESMTRPVAISNECVIPMLVQLKKESETEHSKKVAADNAKHWRHIYYMVFSVFAGAKIGNTTARLHEIGKESRSARILKPLASGLFRALFRVISLTRVAARLVLKAVKLAKVHICRALRTAARLTTRNRMRDLPADE